MPRDYRPFIGRRYQAPHGCFRLVAQVYEEAYNIDVGAQDDGLDPRDMEARMQRLHERLVQLCTPVQPGEEQEGDVIIIRSNPRHMALVVDPERHQMLHTYGGGESCIEDYSSWHWRNRIESFWRYNG